MNNSCITWVKVATNHILNCLTQLVHRIKYVFDLFNLKPNIFVIAGQLTDITNLPKAYKLMM